jgi:hypothetical protein
MMNIDKLMDWAAAFMVGYVIGVSIGAVAIFYGAA